MPQETVFLAGPFFNADQRVTMDWLATCFELEGHRTFHPRRDVGRVDPTDPVDAKRCFDEDIKGLEDCTVVVFNLEYQLPDFQKLALVDLAHRSEEVLHLPDTGTVWEMGCAWNMGLSGVGWFPTLSADLLRMKPLNLMLTQSLRGFLLGKHEMAAWARALKEYGLKDALAHLRHWEGRNT
jgi:hypothetical protein